MAERRMFAKSIIDSDAFLDMPLSTQALYFHLAMRADDDGFVNNPKKISRMIGSNEDDMKVLLSKRFIMGFDSGVIVIKHWRIHNVIQNDRYHPTNYIDEFNQLWVDDTKNYHIEDEPISITNQSDTKCIQDVSSSDTSGIQDVYPGKVRLGKVRLDKTSQDKQETVVSRLFEFWKTTLHHERSKLDPKRHSRIRSALKLGYTEDELRAAIVGCSKTPFNMGKNDRGVVYDDLELILRDAKHIDQFIANAGNQFAESSLPKGYRRAEV